jgi:hypothetical protein
MRKLLYGLFLLATLAGAQSYTPNLNLAEPPAGYPNWTTIINGNWAKIDTAVGSLQLLYQGNWNSGFTYSKGQLVTASGTLYVSLTNSNMNNTPSTSTSNWLSFGLTSSGTAPAGASGQLQTYGTSSTLAADNAFTLTAGTHTLSEGKAGLVSLQGAFEQSSVPTYDPLNTAYSGGLAAAVAGTSGYTPTQVLNATSNYAECQYQMGVVATPAFRVIVPANLGTINVGGALMWSEEDFGGTSVIAAPNFQHNDSTQPMITGHIGTDTLTCSNSVTYTPGIASNVWVHNIQIAGMGAVNSDNDIGVRANGYWWIVERIGGFGQGFGGPGIFNSGFGGYLINIGLPGAQIKGCMSYTQGGRSISNAAGALCGGIEDTSIDSFNLGSLYGTTGYQSVNSNHAASPCYPYCSGILILADGSASENVFGQISDNGIIFGGLGAKAVNLRSDGSSREGVFYPNGNFGGGANNGAQSVQVANVEVSSPCTDTSLNVGTARNCARIVNGGQGNATAALVAADAPGAFGSSYLQCDIIDNEVGASSQPSMWTLPSSYSGNPANATPNNLAFCSTNGFGNDHASARVIFPTGSPYYASATASVNASGITQLILADTTEVTTLNYGVPQQDLHVFGNTSGASIGPGGNIVTCNGAVEYPTITKPTELIQVQGFSNNVWAEIGCNGSSGGVVNTVSGSSSSAAITVTNGGTSANPTIALAPNLSGTGSLLASTTGIGSSTNCLQADGSGNIIPSSSPSCGGAGGVIPGTQYQIPAYLSGGATVGGSNITVDSTGNNLTVPGTITGSGSTNGYGNFVSIGAAAPAPTGNTYQITQSNTLTNPISWLPDPSPVTGLPYDTVTLTSGVQREVNGHLALPTCTSQVLTFNGTSFSCVTAGTSSAVPTAATAIVIEDFLSGQPTASGNIGNYGWLTNTVVGGTPTYSAASSATHPGIEQVSTPATSGDGAGIYMGSVATLYLAASTPWQAEWIADFSNVTNGAYRVGFYSAFAATQVPVNGLYFRYDTSLSDTHIMACSDSSSTETCTSTGVTPVVNTYYDFNISSTTAGTASFNINGGTAVTICASGCTATATLTASPLSPAAGVVATSATSIAIALDYFSYYISGLTR